MRLYESNRNKLLHTRNNQHYSGLYLIYFCSQCMLHTYSHVFCTVFILHLRGRPYSAVGGRGHVHMWFLLIAILKLIMSHCLWYIWSALLWSVPCIIRPLTCRSTAAILWCARQETIDLKAPCRDLLNSTFGSSVPFWRVPYRSRAESQITKKKSFSLQ